MYNDNNMDSDLYVNQIINVMRKTLNEREFNVVHSIMVYGEKKSKLAKEYGVSNSRIVQIEARGLRRLRQEIARLESKDYFRFMDDGIL